MTYACPTCGNPLGKGTLQALAAMPQQPSRQDALADQMSDLYLAAIRLGCDDAANWIARSSPFAWVKPGTSEEVSA